MEAGQPISFSCVVVAGNPAPSVTWLFAPADVEQPEATLEPIDASNWAIDEAIPEDSGSYTCVVDNGVGPAVRKLYAVTVSCECCDKRKFQNDFQFQYFKL